MPATPPPESSPPPWAAMELPAPGSRLRPVWRERPPAPAEGQLRIVVTACGVCRTDLHLVDGELAFPGHAVVPGHEIVGQVAEIGPGVNGWTIGERVGVPWLGWACGVCADCRRGRENLCRQARFTGWQLPGGYAQQVLADAGFVLRLPQGYSDVQAAPLLCAGLIGHRAYTMAGDDARDLGAWAASALQLTC